MKPQQLSNQLAPYVGGFVLVGPRIPSAQPLNPVLKTNLSFKLIFF